MSEHYIVSARKYRPATFNTVVGQKNLTDTLKGAIASGRLAHAYLFCGPRGVGKTSCARIFARTINCLSPTPDGEACGECESCRAIDRGNSFNLMELDAASNNGVDDIRVINEQVNIPPQVGKYRVFIIDEVHMLTPAAFNAFLKTLEEPPAYAVFILATTEKHKVIPTILSRCQIYDFKRITIDDMVDHLEYVARQEGMTADRKALGVIARKADGAMRDALSIFDQVATSAHGNLTYETAISNLNVLDYDYFFSLIEAFASGDAGGALLLYKEIRDRGFDSLFFVNSLAQHVRDLMVSVDPRTVSLLESSEDVAQRLVEQARSLPLQWYYAAMKLLNDCDRDYRMASSKQLLVELTLIRLCQLLKPAQPPFEATDRHVALRNPSEPSGAAVAEQPRQTAESPQPEEVQAARASQVPPALRPSAPPPQKVIATPPVAQPGAARVSGRPHSFNVRNTSAVSAGSIERQREEYSETDLLRVWKEFGQSVPEQVILSNTINVVSPKPLGNLAYEIMVDNPAQRQAFESSMPQMLKYIRERLRNDFITFSVVVNPSAEVVKYLSPKDFVAKAVGVNPALGQFLKDLDVELV